MENLENKTKEQLQQEVEVLRKKLVTLEMNNIRIESEEFLTDSEENYKLLYENAPLPFHSLNKDGIFIDVNQAWLQTLGYKREEVIGKPYGDFLHPDYQEHFKNKFPVFKACGSVHTNFKLQHKDGHYIEILLDGSIGYLPDGSFKQTYCVFQDITERKKVEEELYESEEKFRRIFEFSPNGKSMTGIDGTLHVNKAFCEIVGYSEDELRQKNWKEITHPDDIEKSETMVQALIDGKMDRAKFQKRYLHKNGQIVWTDVITAIFKDKEGKNQSFITTIIDITERKQNEQKLERLSRIFEDSLNEIYLFYSDTFRFVQVNNAALTNLDYTMEEMQNMTPLDIKPEYTIELFEKLVEPLKSGEKQKIVFETVHQRKDKSLYPTEIHLQLLNFEGEQLFSAIISDTTKRKQAEETLTKQSKKLTDILEGTNAGTWEWNVQTGAVVLNERWADIMGYTLEELEHIDINTWINSVHPNDLPATNAALEKHFKGELNYFDVEFRQPHKNGSWVWVNVRGKVIEWTEEGKPLQMSGTHLDITERKLAEIMFRDEKERIRTILDMVEDPIFVKDHEHKITLANQAFYDIFGLDENSVIGYTLVEAVPEPERHHFLKVDRSVLDTGIPDMREEELTVGNFTRTIITRKKRFIDESGKIFLVGSINEITERKLAEKELQKTSMLLAEILNTIPIRVFWKDIESNYLGCNLPFAQDAGYEKPENVVGKTDYQMFVEEHAENFRADDRKVMESGIPKIGFEEAQENFDGFDHWVRTSKVPLKDKTGKTIGVLGTYEDITERKQAEEELKKYREQLEVLVQERTIELETKNKELNNAMKVFVGREMTIRDLQARIKALGGK